MIFNLSTTCTIVTTYQYQKTHAKNGQVPFPLIIVPCTSVWKKINVDGYEFDDLWIKCQAIKLHFPVTFSYNVYTYTVRMLQYVHIE